MAAVNNNLLARVIFGNKLATKEQIQALWPQVSDSKDIAMLLVEAGVMDISVHAQLIQFTIDLEKEGQPPAPVTGKTGLPFPAFPQSTAPVAPAPKKETGGLQIEGNQVFGIATAAAASVERLDLVQSSVLHNEPIAPTRRGSKVLEDGAGTPHPVSETIPADASLENILALARVWGASDVHFVPDRPLYMRRFGQLAKIEGFVPTKPILQEWVRRLVKGPVPEGAEAGQSFCRGLLGLGRIRFTAVPQGNSFGLHCRLIPSILPTTKELQLPDACLDLANAGHGLILVSGAGSSGRTSTALSLARLVASRRKAHVVTICRPCEYLPTQVTTETPFTAIEVGVHCANLDQGLSHALLTGCDVIVVDALRSADEMMAALRAATSGRLVIAVSTGVGALATLSSFLESIPSHPSHDEARHLLADSLRGVVSQVLLPKRDHTGVVLAIELLKGSASISNLIRKGELLQIPAAMSGGGKNSGIALDDSIEKLLQTGLIDQQEAWATAIDPRRFQNRTKGK